jgi:two-component system, OmpR family, alkaline phosphatase synthesis response regulator PhoP
VYEPVGYGYNPAMDGGIRACLSRNRPDEPRFSGCPTPRRCFISLPALWRTAEMAEKSRILIADDNQPNCELLEAYLANLDCDVEFAVDGHDTLEKVKSFRPDLILLDVMMPRLSGFEVCRQLKDDPETSRIMILMVTALNELGDIERAVQAKTDDFLSKPVNKIELLKRVENMLKLKDVRNENERLRLYIESMEESANQQSAS